MIRKRKEPKQIDTSTPPIAKYGLALGRNIYIQLEDSKALFKSKRHFTIFEWSNTFSTDKNLYAYVPWVTFAGGRFRGYKGYYYKVTRHTAMKPMHRWFNSDQELKEWLGDEMFNLLVADLI